jgi:hypothetical protein
MGFAVFSTTCGIGCGVIMNQLLWPTELWSPFLNRKEHAYGHP